MGCATSNKRANTLVALEGCRSLLFSSPRCQSRTLFVSVDHRRLPSASVIIPTKNRPDDLERTVSTLLGQSSLPQELIIIDQSADEESHRGVERQFRQAPPGVREGLQLRYRIDASITGGAEARNRAMDIASGEVWVFLDDDVILEPDFLEELLRAYDGVPELTGVSGVITNYSPPKLWVQLWNIVFRRGPFHDERQPIYWSAERLRHAPPIPVSRFGGGLMSFRASAVKHLRFDENLRGVSEGEDVDFCCRLPAGSRLVICPRARLAHMMSPQGRANDHWLNRMVLGTHFLYRKNWRRGVINRLWFLWLNLGCGLLATAASARRGSLEPWRDLLAGMAEARNRARRTPPART